MVNIDYLYNPDAAKDLVNKNYFLDKKLGFQIIENGMILPHKGDAGINNLGGIVDNNGNFIRGTSVTYYTGGSYTPPKINSTHIRNRRLSWYVLQRLGTYHNG